LQLGEFLLYSFILKHETNGQALTFQQWPNTGHPGGAGHGGGRAGLGTDGKNTMILPQT